MEIDTNKFSTLSNIKYKLKLFLVLNASDELRPLVGCIYITLSSDHELKIERVFGLKLFFSFPE